MTNSKVPLASKVGDSVGSVEITDMWQTHFSDLLISVHNIDSKKFVCEHIDAVPHNSNITITADHVRDLKTKCTIIYQTSNTPCQFFNKEWHISRRA